MTHETEPKPRDAEYWAQPVSRLKAGQGGVNIDGRLLTGPQQGFGQMWRKTFWVNLIGAPVTPADVVRVWKENFPKFWPQGNRFATASRIAPGNVAALNLAEVAGSPLIRTGVLVIYADDESFSFMTPEGHPCAGFITFSAHSDSGTTVAQAQVQMRANDPIYEAVLRLTRQQFEDAFWRNTLTNLAEHFGVAGLVQQSSELLDPKVQWRKMTNIWRNAGAWTALYTVTTPIRRLLRR